MNDSNPTAPNYKPPAELVARAVHELTVAPADELTRAGDLFRAYGAATENRSAVSGAVLPGFDACPPLVRYGWLCAARESNARNPGQPPTPAVYTRRENPTDPSGWGYKGTR